jgi:hypothetical protein
MTSEKLPLSELKDRLRWIKSNLEKSREDWNGDFNYEIPYAGFSDYSGCMVERANSRTLEETYSFVTLDTAGMGTVYTVIRSQDVLDAIFSEDFPEFMEAVDSLSDYPVLDESLMSEMEMEAGNEAWENYVRSDFRKEIEKEHGPQWELNGESGFPVEMVSTLEDALDGLTEKELVRLFSDLCEISGRYFEIETGGNAYIDLEKLVENLPYKMLIEVVTGVYFIKPDAVQTLLPLTGRDSA